MHNNDNLTPGSIADSLVYDRRKNNRNYICSNCARSFLSPVMQEKCKYCGSADIKLGKEPIERRRLYYRCDKCGKDFVVGHVIDKCECGEIVKKLYDVDKMMGPTGRLSARMAQVKHYILKNKKLKTNTQKEMEKQRKKRKREIKIRNIKFPKIRRRPKEEMPTR